MASAVSDLIRPTHVTVTKQRVAGERHVGCLCSPKDRTDRVN